MYSTFDVNSDGCLICNSGVMSELGKLQGVFGAEVDFVNNRVVVNHTDEVSREQIAKKLEELGFFELKTDCEL
ncbi:MAG TPA: heavy-metal-associated domain-containing protein [Bacteroidales bacterium]|nr:heavy-metal-associated domain-containing protein [Bacteroidales bacterium]